MVVAGIYCRSTPDTGLEASVALVDGTRLVEHLDRRAPGPVGAAFLEDLRVSAAGLLERWRPTRVVLWQLAPVISGVPGGVRGASAGIRAEGALCCAAASSGLEVAVMERDDLLSGSGATRVDAAVRELTRRLDPQPAEHTVLCAAAAALATR